jgi:phage shock protein PspC (stress-responsive transcriptional regulator)
MIDRWLLRLLYISLLVLAWLFIGVTAYRLLGQ